MFGCSIFLDLFRGRGSGVHHPRSPVWQFALLCCALGRLSANDGAGAHRPLSLVVPGCRSREIVCRRWVRCTSSAVPVGRAAFKLLTVCQVARFCRASRPRGRQLNRCIPGNQVALYTLSMASCHTEARVHAYAAARQTWRAALAVWDFFFWGT